MKKVGLILDANTINDIARLASEAESAGFDSVWATELYRTSFQQIAAAAHTTKSIRLGTAVAFVFVRSPMTMALTAMDLDEISSGRFLLGLGTGAKRTNEMWHGIPHGKPVTRIKECIEIIRGFVSGSHTGELFEFNGEYYDISTKGYHRAFKPHRTEIPVFLAAVGGKMAQASGYIADGYLGHVVCSFKYLKEVVCPSVEEGIMKSGRKPGSVEKASIITCAISEDRKAAMRAAKATIAFYATVRTYEPPFRLHGFEAQTAKIRDAFFKKDVDAMIENVSDEMAETFAVVGNAAECVAKVDKYREIIDLPILSAPHYYIDFEEVKSYQKVILEVFGNY